MGPSGVDAAGADAAPAPAVSPRYGGAVRTSSRGDAPPDAHAPPSPSGASTSGPALDLQAFVPRRVRATPR